LKIINFLIQAISIVCVSVFISFLIIPYVDRYFEKTSSQVKELEKKPDEQSQVNKNAIEEPKEKVPTPKIENKESNVEVPASVAKTQKSTPSNENSCANDSEILLVDLTLNLMTIPEPVRVEKLPNGNFVLPESLLKELNIIPNAQKIRTSDCLYGYLFDGKSGFKFKYDAEKFSLDINVPYEAFALNVFDQKPITKIIPEPPLLGAYMNYQLYGTQTKSASTASTSSVITNTGSGLLEPVIFGKIGSLSNSFAISESKSGYSITRADSFFQKDFPESLQSLIVGDTSNTDGTWSRSAHYLGLRWSTNYATQPGYIYAPNPIISGSAAIPSVVDVYINNQKTFSQKVSPGPFDFTHLPIPDGAGQVSLVVKDLLGNEQIITKDWYLSSMLLAKDEKNFSVETGFLRKAFGTDSAKYSDPFASTSYMYGVTNATTAQSRFEIQQKRQAVGGNLSTTLGNFALLNAVGALSNDDAFGIGNQYGVGLQQQSNSFAANISLNRYNNDFRQFASNEDDTKPKMKLNAGVNIPIKLEANSMFPQIKSGIGINYVESSNWNDVNFKSVSVSSGIPLPYGGSLSLYANKRMDDVKAWSTGISIGYTFGNYSARMSTSKDPSGIQTTATSISSNVPSGPGMGWSAYNEDFKNNVKLNALINTNSTQLTANLSKKDGLVDGKRIGVSGSAGLLEKEFFVSRTISDGSFALVKVGTFPDVPIYSQNNLVAYSSQSGFAAFPIRPYEKGKIEIKEEEMPLELESKIVQFNPTAYARTGVFINFPVKYSKNLLIHIKLPNGSNVPAGAYARLMAGEEQYIVAKDGEVYLTSLSEKNRVIVTWLENKCEFDLEVDMKKTDQEIIEPFVCSK